MGKISRVTFGPDRLPVPGGVPPRFVAHEFVARADGQLEHRIDAATRAVVPPEGWDAYAEAWPEAAEAIGELRGRPVVAQTVFLGAAGLRDAIAAANVARANAGRPAIDPGDSGQLGGGRDA